jgi:hypothetical protein
VRAAQVVPISPISFSDEERDLLSTLASALPPSVPDDFLQPIADKLGAYPQEARGVGLLHRIAAHAQRDFVKAGPVAVAIDKYGRTQPRRQQGRRR